MLGERLKSLRENRNMTQEQLAKLIGMSQQSIDHYENGRANPSIETLKRLVEVFNTTVDYLLGLTDNPNRPEDAPAACEPDYLQLVRRFLADPSIPEEEKADAEKKLASYIRFVIEQSRNPDR